MRLKLIFSIGLAMSVKIDESWRYHAPNRLKHHCSDKRLLGNSGDFAVPNSNVPYCVQSALRIHDASTGNYKIKRGRLSAGYR